MFHQFQHHKIVDQRRLQGNNLLKKFIVRINEFFIAPVVVTLMVLTTLTSSTPLPVPVMTWTMISPFDLNQTQNGERIERNNELSNYSSNLTIIPDAYLEEDLELEEKDRSSLFSAQTIADFVKDIISPSFSSSLVQKEAEEEIGNEFQVVLNSSDLLSRLVENVFINWNSIIPLQFYNLDYEKRDQNETDNQNSSTTTEVPNVIFGSPLCLGLCLNGQFYAENTSIRLLSDKSYSLFGPKSPQAMDKNKEVELVPNLETGIDLPTESSGLGWLNHIYNPQASSIFQSWRVPANRFSQLVNDYNPFRFVG